MTLDGETLLLRVEVSHRRLFPQGRMDGGSPQKSSVRMRRQTVLGGPKLLLGGDQTELT